MRDPDEGIVAGICAGFARRYAIDPALIRVATVVLTIATGGLFALAYAFLWAVMPARGYGRAGARGRSDATGETAAGSAADRSRGSWIVGTGAGLVVLGLLFIFRELDIWWSDALVWPLVLAATGAALVWRQFSGGRESDESGEGEAATPDRPRRSRLGPYRGGFGIALLLGAAVLFLYINGALEAGGQVALAGLTAVVVIGLVLAPLWARLAGSLSAERAERIRSQERAELAAHLHDSVLQTLALIQKNPGDSRRISTLARSQERELREWLSGKGNDSSRLLADSLKAAAAEVEELHQVPIDAVTVGDRALDERSQALVAASREALTNAARHAGDEGAIRLYAEITPERSQVFIRDRGVGFEPDAVPEDRHGVRDSILGRMERHGGRAEIRSEPGEGTEIELTLEAE